ncbi:mannose-6-phosphate isomerase-like protein (cupin superfamily) [Kineothrix alysoides]|uniref:Mannose-6-phosphate isomerase-like protein (Cupin superfamily) n=1 Tax=Kineothrix alysoides TaxID=1469948 RepID=A0A4R1R0Y7_9FIRM|nr:cupin domain-containing protein [Kineothrix alysoides]TCL58962.1 mannose-6-phosphate isomerase-like protein (cupin superfamily) [Kineothrix alysoides]
MDIYTDGFPGNSNNINQGAIPFVTNLRQDVLTNTNFFTARWTGLYMQLGLMTIPANGEAGLDMLINSDQFYYIEQGTALVIMGMSQEYLNFQTQAYKGFSIFVPSGTWHNILNIGNINLKMFLTIAPPFLPYNTNFEKTEDWIPAKYY